MSTLARVAKGEDRGEYRRDDTDYGATFWRRTDKPHQVPVTDATFQRWLKSGKAVPLDLPPRPVTPPPIQVHHPETEPDDEAGTFEGADIAESNWIAEVQGWDRLRRLDCLRAAGSDVPGWWDKHRLADELLKLHRRSRGKRGLPAKRPRMPQDEATPPEVRSAVPEPARPAGGEPWAGAWVISTPGVVFPGNARAEDFYPQNS